MRIITGIYKGRSFDVPRSFKARPTTDFAKENIFNVVRQYVDFDEATALDLFSGTGSITYELLSRGCKSVVSIEKDADHFRFILSVLKKLNAENCTPIHGDVFSFLKKNKIKFDFVFADPPYKLETLSSLPDIILQGETMLKIDGILVLEHGKDYDFSNHRLFIDHRQYGSVNFSIFQNKGESILTIDSQSRT